MRLLVDAHALLWWLVDSPRLSTNARDAIDRADEPLLSAGTLMELAVKRSRGRLPFDEDWPERSREAGFGLLAFGWAHAARLQALPFATVAGREHKDPFDRMLAAQALVEGIPVVTVDPAIGAHGVPVIW